LVHNTQRLWPGRMTWQTIFFSTRVLIQYRLIKRSFNCVEILLEWHQYENEVYYATCTVKMQIIQYIYVDIYIYIYIHMYEKVYNFFFTRNFWTTSKTTILYIVFKIVHTCSYYSNIFFKHVINVVTSFTYIIYIYIYMLADPVDVVLPSGVAKE